MGFIIVKGKEIRKKNPDKSKKFNKERRINKSLGYYNCKKKIQIKHKDKVNVPRSASSP